MAKHKIHLIGGEDDEAAVVTCHPHADSCRIDFHYRDRVIEEEALELLKDDEGK